MCGLGAWFCCWLCDVFVFVYVYGLSWFLGDCVVLFGEITSFGGVFEGGVWLDNALYLSK